MSRQRDNNTVKAIVASVMSFLEWLQGEVLVGQRLVGTGREYKIRLIEKRLYDSRGRPRATSRVYFRLPPRETKEPKRPLSRDKRDLLWQAVTDVATSLSRFPSWAKGENDQAQINAYLKSRRELLLELLEATGARPGELALLKLSQNEDCYSSGTIVLTTLKRRRSIDRRIKLQPGVAMRLAVFISVDRAKLLKRLGISGNDRIFLTLDGGEMVARSLSSEFGRLRQIAGLGDYQACMSMFRHRFITKQVAIHLGIYLSKENKAKEMMTDADYRSILKKVATITGHGNEESLLHYLDLAWEELGVFDRVEVATRIDSAIEGSNNIADRYPSNGEQEISWRCASTCRRSVEVIANRYTVGASRRSSALNPYASLWFLYISTIKLASNRGFSTPPPRVM
jgi:site-specific recombinase XerD